jgi:hypothetical protein
MGRIEMERTVAKAGAKADTHNRHGDSKRRHDGNGAVEVAMVGLLRQETEVESENRHLDESAHAANVSSTKMDLFPLRTRNKADEKRCRERRTYV